MTISDWMIVVATLAGPILAVQAQKAIEKARESRGRKGWVFHQLMATRSARVSGEHVQALNMIDLAFYGKGMLRRRSRKEQTVLNRWREYHDHLKDRDQQMVDADVWISKGDELFVNLLEAIADDVGYQFDRVQLRKGSYSPEAHGKLESEQHQVRQLVIEVLNGARSLRMDVASFPVDEDAMKAQTELLGKLDALISTGEIPVRISDAPSAEEVKQPAGGAAE
ncbi:DUF6680 family protein [Stenotrophomonas rhizophila]